MNHKTHNQIVNFIWSIADDVLRDDFVRGKYRDIILPFTVLRRLDVLLVDTKEKVLETNAFLEKEGIDNKDGLIKISGYPFYNTSGFTMADNSDKDAEYSYTSLLNDPANIDSNLEAYLDGFSPNIQQIIDRFEIRKQLQKLRENELTFHLIEKYASKEINLSPKEAFNSKGEKLPPLTNLGMGYVFEELIRKFNEENNEEAGEHFTPREIIKLMTQMLFRPVKEKLKAGGAYSIYDPACGSGGMLTEAEKYAKRLVQNATFNLHGQEVNPETWAICTSDMLIKDENPENIVYGSTLSNDGFSSKEFDFMLSNPPYGKSWKKDEDRIVDDRGKKGKELIKDSRFQIGLPTISDGQLLFLTNMVHKKKKHTDLGSRVATVHNGSALFTGDAGGGESEIRKYLIENDLIECIVALPENIFYNTGIPTYIWVLSNRKQGTPREGKIQLINAVNEYEPLRRNLGQKNCELSSDQIENITKTYLNFDETPISKIFNNNEFGYWKITVERPLRLKSQFSEEAINGLRFHDSIRQEMEWLWDHAKEEVYNDLKPWKQKLESHLDKEEIKISPANKKKLLSVSFWKERKKLMELGHQLMKAIGIDLYDDFNKFSDLLSKEAKALDQKVSAPELKAIAQAVSWKDEEAKEVIKKKEKDGTIFYEPDPDLRDTESVSLTDDIEAFFKREVLPYVPDAWIDHDKTVIGYSISFTRYFYQYEPPRDLEDIKREILQLEEETEGILEEIVKD